MNDDISNEYLKSATDQRTASSVSDFEGWMQHFAAGDKTQEEAGASPFVDAVAAPPKIEGKPLPAPKPQRRQTDDPLGRIEGQDQGTTGTVMRNISEAPKQLVAGVDDAARNALSFMNPLTDWLNDNVADLRYDPVKGAKTPTGEISRKLSEFLTGFIPALKGLRAVGATGKVLAPMAAGAIASFAVQDPHGGRLSDLWNTMGLPKNILTDYMKSDPTDSEVEGRFKNALEGVAAGAAVEGIILGARALRAAGAVAKQTKSEIEFLKGKYGSVSDEEVGILGKGIESDYVVPVQGVDESRRKFLKGAAAAVGSAAIPGAGKIGEAVNAGIQVARGTAAAALPAIKTMLPMESLFSDVWKVGKKHIGALHQASKNYPPKIIKEIDDELIKLGGKIDIPPELSFSKVSTHDVEKLAESVVKSNPKLALDDTPGMIVLPDGNNINVIDYVTGQVMRKKGIYPYYSDVETATTDFLNQFNAVNPKLSAIYKKHNVWDAENNAVNPFAVDEISGTKKWDAMFKEVWASMKAEGIDVHGLTVTGVPSRVPKAGLYRALGEEPPTPVKKVTAASRAAQTDASIDQSITQQLRPIGDPAKPVIEMKGPAGKIAKGLEETTTTDPRALIRTRGANMPEDFDVYVNFARIDEPDQVKFVIGKMAEKMKDSIDEATRGVITQKETQRLADEMGLSVTDILTRKKGETWNAETAVAARQLWAASGEKLLETAKAAAAKNAGPIDQYNFRKMMAVHSAIQSEVIGARTETARSLASWAIPAGGVEKARAIESVMQAMGGPEVSSEMARRLAILAEAGASPATLARFAERGAGAATVDAIKAIWINGLLANPTTHIVNTTSNMLVAFQSIYERAAAAGIGVMTGSEGVRAGEAAAMAFGMIGATKDAFKAFAVSLKTGQSGMGFGKVDLMKPNALTAEAFGMSKETGLGRTVDFLGQVAQVPTHLLGAEDEFFKTIGYRMELRAQALRTATQEGKKGADAARRIEEILLNPPEHIRINAVDTALYQTFTNEVGWFGRAAMNLREAGDPINPTIFVLPFIRTPVNIARYAFERSPLAPLVGQWRADVAAGGARADLALARMSTGTAIMMTAMDYADSGVISGAGPNLEDRDVKEALIRQGWTPYSVKLGNRWYSYNRTDPMGMTLGFAASITEAVKKGEIDHEDVDEWYEVAAMSIAAVSQVTISKTYLQGFAKFVEVMSDPKRFSQKYIDDLVASFLPATGLMQATKNVVDPIQREVGSPADAVMARIAGLSDKLPPRRNLWGEPVSAESGLGKAFDFVTPVRSKQEQVNPADREMVRLNQGPLRITKKPVFDGVQVNMKQYPEVYDAYTRLSGNELKPVQFGGLGAKDYLNSVVDGKHPMSAVYSIMSDESRKQFITNTIQDYRKLAQQHILGDPKYKNFSAEVQHLKGMKMDSRMPYLGGAQ